MASPRNYQPKGHWPTYFPPHTYTLDMRILTIKSTWSQSWVLERLSIDSSPFMWLNATYPLWDFLFSHQLCQMHAIFLSWYHILVLLSVLTKLRCAMLVEWGKRKLTYIIITHFIFPWSKFKSIYNELNNF
jgi:hypothetical protein